MVNKDFSSNTCLERSIAYKTCTPLYFDKTLNKSNKLNFKGFYTLKINFVIDFKVTPLET